MLSRQRYCRFISRFTNTRKRKFVVSKDKIDLGPSSDREIQDLTKIKLKTWGGLHGIPLVTSKYVRLNVQLGSSEKYSRGVVRSPTVCLIVHAYIVPDKPCLHRL